MTSMAWLLSGRRLFCEPREDLVVELSEVLVAASGNGRKCGSRHGRLSSWR